MNNTEYLKNERILSENTVNDSTSDFTEKYFAVSHLLILSETNPEIIAAETVFTLESLLKVSKFAGQRQGFFLFRQAAETLASVIIHSEENDLADQALSALGNVLSETTGHAHRAAAEALGALPFSIQGPDIKEPRIQHIPHVSWKKVLDEKRLNISCLPAFVGRSLVAQVDNEDKLLVFKLARAEDSPDALLRESLWMEHLCSQIHTFPVRFDIPGAIKIEESHVFKLRHLPVKSPEDAQLHPKGYAIAFVANKDYFTYPNDSTGNRASADTEFSEVMFRNAWLLGKLTAQGIVHSALIPLFHNRVQRERRRDNGFYEWFRGGRLDRWLESCAYPNLGLTGIRDFEHFTAFKGSNRNLYRHIGSHFLSLLLVAGSYFRNKNRDRVGFDAHGAPADTRDLFDKQLLGRIIQGVFVNYYNGFSGTESRNNVPFDLDTLVSRMIEEMGVDRYMEEMLRAADQNQMSDKAFRRFLSRRGYSEEKINGIQKGAEDIVIHSGPHLGGFNQRISLPELIESVEAMAALCISGRYFGEKGA